MDKMDSMGSTLRLENPIFISTPADFGGYYSGSSKAKQMKRKRGAMLHSTIKDKVMRQNRRSKYNRL